MTRTPGSTRGPPATPVATAITLGVRLRVPGVPTVAEWVARTLAAMFLVQPRFCQDGLDVRRRAGIATGSQASRVPRHDGTPEERERTAATERRGRGRFAPHVRDSDRKRNSTGGQRHATEREAAAPAKPGLHDA